MSPHSAEPVPHRLPLIASRAKSDMELDIEQNVELDQAIKWFVPRDVDGLTTQLIELLADSDLRDRLELSGYHFSQQFAWSNIAIAHQEVYQMVLGKMQG
jgi:glycosyltransferase involved in cell wall biosynthesis